MNKIRVLFFIAAMLFLNSCATSNHGSFVPSTYKETHEETVNEKGTKVIGVSKQTWFLYIFPMGNAPSTDEAISDAKSKIKDTKFLADLSIDDRTNWKVGYSEQLIEVKATAFK